MFKTISLEREKKGSNAVNLQWKNVLESPVRGTWAFVPPNKDAAF